MLRGRWDSGRAVARRARQGPTERAARLMCCCALNGSPTRVSRYYQPHAQVVMFWALPRGKTTMTDAANTFFGASFRACWRSTARRIRSPPRGWWTFWSFTGKRGDGNPRELARQRRSARDDRTVASDLGGKETGWTRACCGSVTWVTAAQINGRDGTALRRPRNASTGTGNSRRFIRSPVAVTWAAACAQLRDGSP
jgi:hypothetical protein